MPRRIAPVGRFYDQDPHGWLIPAASAERIGAEWWPALRFAAGWIAAHDGPERIATLVRGSVADGSAVRGLSDLDLVVLSSPGADGWVRWRSPAWADALGDALASGFDVRALDVAEASWDPTFPAVNPRLQAVIDLQAVCLDGRDVRFDRRYRPGPELMFASRWLADDLRDARAAAPSADGCARLAKVVVRAGFELVMVDEGRYTTSLYWCAEAFGRRCPDRADDMQAALALFLDPNATATAFDELDRLGSWIVDQARARGLAP